MGATQAVKEGIASYQQRMRKYKRDKLDPTTREAQARVGQSSGDAMSGFETAMRENTEGVGEFISRNTESISGGGGGSGDVSDVSEANYSSTSTAQTSSGKGKKADLSGQDRKKAQGASKQLTAKQKKAGTV